MKNEKRQIAPRRFGIAAILMAIPLTACEPNLGEPPSDLAATHVVQPTTAPQAYVLQPGDNIEVKFAYVPDLNQNQIIRPDGKISLQLVHDVQAAGLTPSQLQDRLLHALLERLGPAKEKRA